MSSQLTHRDLSALAVFFGFTSVDEFAQFVRDEQEKYERRQFNQFSSVPPPVRLRSMVIGSGRV